MSMADDLRTRIAAVVDERIRFWEDKQGYLIEGIDGEDVADAVIAELAVIQETRQCEKAGGGFSQWHRYVTDWKANDD